MKIRRSREQKIDWSISILSKHLNCQPSRWDGVLGIFDEPDRKSIKPTVSDALVPGSRYYINPDEWHRMFRNWWMYTEIKNSRKKRPTIIDLGCGSCGLQETFYRNWFTDIECIGLELDNSRCKKAAELYPSFPWIVLRYDLEKGLPFNDKVADFFIYSEVMEHLGEEQNKNLMKEMCRCLKDEGKILITTPNGEFSESVHDWHAKEYTVSEVKGIVETSKMKIDKRVGFSVNLKRLNKVFPDKVKEWIQNPKNRDIYDRWYKMLEIYPYEIVAMIFPEAKDIASSMGYIVSKTTEEK